MEVAVKGNSLVLTVVTIAHLHHPGSVSVPCRARDHPALLSFFSKQPQTGQLISIATTDDGVGGSRGLDCGAGLLLCRSADRYSDPLLC